MSQEEGDDLSGDWAEVAVAADAGDPLERGGERDDVCCVGIEGGAGGDAGSWVVRWGTCARGIEEGVEAAGFGGGGESSSVGEHVLCGGDDGVGAWGGEFDPVGEV